MNLWKYEIKKIISQKYVLVLLVLLFTSNIITAVYFAREEDGLIPDHYMIQIMNMYKENPDFVKSEYNRLKTDYDRQIEAILYSIETTGEALPLVVQTNYIKYQTYTDYSLFSAFFEYLDKRNNYRDEIQKFIEQAYHNQQNILDYGYDANSYSYQYQNQIINQYTKLQNEIIIDENYAYGWDVLFSYKGTAFFTLLSVLIIGCIIFPNEKVCGFSPILNISKKGGGITAKHKIYAGIVLTIILSLIFTISSIISIGVIRGYSNPFDQIQILDNFILCPYNCTMIETLIIYQLLLIITNVIFISLIMIISIFTYKISISFISGGILLIINYVIQNVNTSNQYKYINFFSTTSLSDIFIRYRAISFLNHSINIHFFLIGIYFLILFAAYTMIIKSSKLQRYISISNMKIFNFKKLKLFFDYNKVVQIKKIKSNKSINYYSLLSWEIRKNIPLIIIAICVVFIKILWSSYIYAPVNSSKDEIFKEYISKLEGELTDEKLEFIDQEMKYITSICDMSEEMINKYIHNIITADEYKEYLNEYKYSYSRVDILKEIKEQAYYLSELRETKNIEGVFIYDTGILLILYRNVDFLLYVLLLLTTGSIFINEYTKNSSSSSIINIIRTTKKGRQKFFHAKFKFICLVAMIIFLAFHFIDINIITNNYTISNLNVPLISLPLYSQISSKITIINYIIYTESIMLVSTILMAILFASFSQLFKKPIFIYSICLMTTFAPRMLSSFGISLLKHFDYTVLMTATNIYSPHVIENFINKYNPMIVLFIALFVTLLTYYKAHQQYCK